VIERRLFLIKKSPGQKIIGLTIPLCFSSCDGE